MKNPFKKTEKSENNGKKNTAPSAFIGKISEFFNPEPQKEKVLKHEDFNRAGDTYYATVSAAYKISQRILILLLVLFLLISLVTNFRSITYDNFFFLLKDFSTAAGSETLNYDTLSYDSNTRHFFSLYRGGLTVVNPSNISVYTATGRKTFGTTSQFSSPCVESSDKYFIIYDTAGNTFSVYNSFARVYTETLDYPVTAASFADNGNMAIVTKDNTHKSLVHIYNKNFKRLFTVPSGKFAFDVAMDSESDKIAVCYYDIGNGSGVSEIVLRNLSNMEEFEKISIEGEFLLKCGFLADGKFAAVTDRSIRVYDKYFAELDAYEYGNGAVSGYDVSEHGAAVSYSLNSQNFAIVFDKSGILLYNDIISHNISDIGVFERFVFLRTDDGIVRMNSNGTNEEFLQSGQGKMLIYGADTALVCGDSKAEYLVFED